MAKFNWTEEAFTPSSQSVHLNLRNGGPTAQDETFLHGTFNTETFTGENDNDV